MLKTYEPRRRYHRIDGWRGYFIPALAVAGASDTGTWSDSPCPGPEVKAELRRLQRECLRPLGIKSRTRIGGSSNVFCGKRWLLVSPTNFAAAAAAVAQWVEQRDRELRYVHDADLEKCEVAL